MHKFGYDEAYGVTQQYCCNRLILPNNYLLPPHISHVVPYSGYRMIRDIWCVVLITLA